MSTVILERNGLKVEAFGEESDNTFQQGRKVRIPERLARKLNRQRDHRQAELMAQTRVRQGDEFERVYQSSTEMQYGATYDGTSMADFFPVDRSCGWASAIQMNLRVAQPPTVASILCCATSVNIVSVNRERKRIYTGFVNLGVASDVCIMDRMAAADADENGGDGSGPSIDIDAEYLEEINNALTEAANMIALHGYDANNVIGLRNNPFLHTVLIDPVGVTNPIISIRKIAQLIELKENRTIIQLDGLFTKTYTLMLPIDLITSLASTFVTLGNVQVSSLAILTGAHGSAANDPSIPKFRVVGLRTGEWHDGTTQIGYIFKAGSSSFAASTRWYKPFSVLDLGNSRHGLREFRYFGARVGSVEITDLSNCLRILIPQA